VIYGNGVLYYLQKRSFNSKDGNLGNNKDCKQDSSKGYTSENNTDFASDNSNFDNTAPYMAAAALAELYKAYLKAPHSVPHLAQC
jgi:hypothetical protein